MVVEFGGNQNLAQQLVQKLTQGQQSPTNFFGSPQGQGLLSAGAALLQSSGAGQNTTQGLGAGLQGFIAGRQTAVKQNQESTLQALNGVLATQKVIDSALERDAAKQGIGGKVGELVNRLMADNPSLSFSDALFQVQTGSRQGVVIQDGAVVPRAGFGESTSGLAQQQAFGKETGVLGAKLELEPSVREAVAIAGQVGTQKGEALARLNTAIATFPRLDSVVSKLSQLGKTATFTKAGQVADAARRQLGLPVGAGGEARVEFTNTINNEVLPLLKQTFGAAFTVAEGESLKATLGDVNLSPLEKDAALKAFIAAKKGQIETLKRETGQVFGNPQSVGFTTSKSSRLEELRAKRARGEL